MELPAPAIRLAPNITMPDKPIIVANHESAHRFMIPWITQERNEAFWIIPLHAKVNMTVVGDRPIQIALGQRGSVITDVQDICRAALLADADSVVMIHNHPPGTNTDPSWEDLQSTERVLVGLSAIDIVLLDHLIMTERDVHSVHTSHPEIWPKRGELGAYLSVAFNMVTDTRSFKEKMKAWRKENHQSIIDTLFSIP